MTTTAVIPTYVASGTNTGGVLLPTFVVSAANVVAGLKLPPYVLNATPQNVGVLPTYTTNQLFYALVGTGGILVSGNSAIVGDVYTPAGGNIVSGAAVVLGVSVLRDEEYPRGGSILNGSAPTLYNRMTGIGVAGSAALSAIQVNTYTITPTGGIITSGIATVSEYLPYIAKGGININGGGKNTNIFIIPVGGQVQVSGAAVVNAQNNIVPIGGVNVTGSAPIIYKNPLYNPSGVAKVGGSALAFAKPMGGVITPENPYNADFNGWAINYETNAPSRYERLAANSMCRIDGITYVANAGGIYALDADDDAGQPIQASVSFGNTDYGDHYNKRISSIYLGMRSNYKMRLNIVANRKSAYYFDIQPPKLNEHGSRLTPGKGLAGLFFALRLDNQHGAFFELDALTLELAVSTRMGL